MPDDLIGEVRAVLEHIDGAAGKARIRLELCEPFGVGNYFFQEILEAIVPAAHRASDSKSPPAAGAF